MSGPVELRTIEWGDGARTLLLVHGLGSNAAGWWRVGPALAEAGFHVFAPDLRGHGGSPRADHYRVDRYGADLLALRDRWDAVVAHSLGGGAATTVLKQKSDWADRVVLIDPFLLILDEAVAVDWLMVDFAEEPTVERLAKRNPTWHAEDTRIKVEALAESGPEVIKATITDNPGFNLVADVVDIQVPTLLIGGDPELLPLVPPVLGESLAGMNPNIEFHTIPGGSHSMHRDEFDALMSHLLRFLADQAP